MKLFLTTADHLPSFENEDVLDSHRLGVGGGLDSHRLGVGGGGAGLITSASSDTDLVDDSEDLSDTDPEEEDWNMDSSTITTHV